MSAKNRINPDHYKTGHPGAPREEPKPGDEQPPVKRRNKNTNFIPGAAPVGETEETEEQS